MRILQSHHSCSIIKNVKVFTDKANVRFIREDSNARIHCKLIEDARAIAQYELTYQSKRLLCIKMMNGVTHTNSNTLECRANLSRVLPQLNVSKSLTLYPTRKLDSEYKGVLLIY